jgi:hypothetical protein
MPRKPTVAKGQVKALEAIQAAGASNRFEEQMLGLALFEHRFGDAQIAEHILWCLAQATGCRFESACPPHRSRAA